MRRRTSLCLLASSIASPLLAAQAWPSRPLQIVVPFPPGGAGDAIPRMIAPRLQQALGTGVIIQNRPGASGVIATDAVAKALPDGHTILSHASSIVIQPHLVPAAHDVLRDLVPITQTVAGSYVLLVRPDFPASSLDEWLRVVRGAPGRLTYGSHGSGSGPHLAMELLKREAGVFIVHVPFRGAAPALRELLAGRIDMAFDTTFTAVPHVRTGRLKPIAVGGPSPVESLPGIACVADRFGGFDTDGWQGFFAPAGTDEAVVARIRRETATALREPEVASAIRDLGFRTVAGTPSEFGHLVRSDFERWGNLVRQRRITAD